MDGDERRKLEKKPHDLNFFKASENWLHPFMKSNNLSRKRGIGSDAFFCLRWTLPMQGLSCAKNCKVPIENILNSHEVAVLYRCLPGRAIHDPVVGSSFIRV